LIIPDNVYIIGTVNMDETTHPFSKKVLDRANTLEFNYIKLDSWPDATSINEIEPYDVQNHFLIRDYLNLVEVYPKHESLIKRTTEKLVRVNAILEEIHAHIGFRVRDTVCF
jgi:5-methylcytosine-specific restriction protein B